MINLDEFIVEIDGKKYLPYETVVEAFNTNITDQLDNKMNEFQNSLNNIVDTFNNIKQENIDD